MKYNIDMLIRFWLLSIFSLVTITASGAEPSVADLCLQVFAQVDDSHPIVRDAILNALGKENHYVLEHLEPQLRSIEEELLEIEVDESLDHRSIPVAELLDARAKIRHSLATLSIVAAATKEHAENEARLNQLKAQLQSAESAPDKAELTKKISALVYEDQTTNLETTVHFAQDLKPVLDDLNSGRLETIVARSRAERERQRNPQPKTERPPVAPAPPPPPQSVDLSRDYPNLTFTSRGEKDIVNSKTPGLIEAARPLLEALNRGQLSPADNARFKLKKSSSSGRVYNFFRSVTLKVAPDGTITGLGIVE